ncbi:MAG: hypothetical protein WCK58_15235 [Chloroflexota bacterium]
MRDLRYLLALPEWGYRGSRASLWFLVVLTALTTARSLVHVLAPDGGAGSIAGIDISVAGGSNIVAVFAQWGWTQLLLALVGWVVIARYRFLIPAVLMLQLLDWGGRALVGMFKPFAVAAPPPGAYGNVIFVPLVLIALWFALPKGEAGEAAS